MWGVGGWVGWVALIKLTGGSDLLLVVLFCIAQPRSEPSSLQFLFDLGTTLDFHFVCCLHHFGTPFSIMKLVVIVH